MMDMSVTELEVSGVRFFSEFDESAFFEWLDKLACVQKYVGRGKTLHIAINKTAMDEANLREFLALFRRYRIPMQQLIVFDCEEFAGWFHDSQAYWYKEIFNQ